MRAEAGFTSDTDVTAGNARKARKMANRKIVHGPRVRSSNETPINPRRIVGNEAIDMQSISVHLCLAKRVVWATTYPPSFD